MSNNNLHSTSNLKKVLFTLPGGIPITSKYLDYLGISRQLAHQYVKSGWLKKLGYGYYRREGDEITKTGAVVGLEMQGFHAHIGGKTALSLHGYTHYLALTDEKLLIYATNIEKLPGWLLERFRCELRMGRLFNEDEKSDKHLYIKRMGSDKKYSPLVSEPERAIIEILDDVPHKQSLDESKKIMESLYNLRPNIIQELLEKCNRIKVKRMFIFLAKKLQLPVLDHLNLSGIDFGSSSVYIISKKKNSIILENPGVNKNE